MKRLVKLSVWMLVFLSPFVCRVSIRAQTKDIVMLRSALPHLSDSTNRADVYNKLGMLYTNRSLDSCYYFSAKALELSKRIGYAVGEGDALNVLAFYFSERGNPYVSYKYINEGLAIFKAHQRPDKIRELTMNRGVLLLREGKYTEALEEYRRAYEQPRDKLSDSIMPLVVLNLATGSYYTAQYADVKPLFDQSEKLAREQRNERFLMSIRQARNAIRFQKKDINPRDAILEQRAIINETLQMGYEYYTAAAYMEMGNMLVHDQIDSARFYYKTGIELAKKTGFKLLAFQLETQAYDALRRVNPTLPDVEIYGREILEWTRHRALEEQRYGVNYLQLSIQEEQVAAEKAKQQQRLLLLVFTTSIGIIALVGAAVIFRMYRSKRKLAKQLVATNRLLEQQNVQLESNNVLHQRIIAVMSHDLRQPLASISMFCDMAMNAQLSSEEREYVFHQLKRTAESSGQVMDGLVQWMKLSALGMAYNPTAVVLKESIRQAIFFNQTVADQKQITIQDEVPETVILIAQAEMLQFINRNIVANAIRHSPDKGTVHIRVSVDADCCTVRISDQGAGIPEEVLCELFTKERTLSREQIVDSGLALVLCHEMILQMNGKIWAENNADCGACFYYQLPISLR